MRVIGIDPGITGAIAILDGRYIEVFDMPVVQDKSKSIVDALALFKIVGARSDGYAVLERVNAMQPHHRGGSGGMSRHNVFSLADSYATARTVLLCAGFEPHKVVPVVWKRHWNLLKRGKEDSRQLILRMLPEHASKFARKKDSGRAEAALIAMWFAETKYGTRY